MNSIHLLCESKSDGSTAVLCWSEDAQALRDEAWRREWARYHEVVLKDVPNGAVTLNPNQTKARVFTVQYVRKFDISMKTVSAAGTEIQNG